ncbi:MAG TPA: helix-turn-helix domain-containing protein [Azonexus sp.]
MSRPTIEAEPPAGNAACLPRSVFHTDGVPPEERFIIWRESVAPLFRPHLAEHVGMADFSGQVDAFMLDDTFLASSALAGIGGYRSSGSGPLDDKAEVFLVQFFLRGGFCGQNGTQILDVQPGDVVILDSTRPLTTQVSDSEMISFIVPRQTLLANMARPVDILPRVISGKTASGRVLGNALLSAWRGLADASIADAQAVKGLLMGALAGLLGSSVTPAGATAANGAAVDQATLNAIRTHIERHLGNPLLGPDLLCRHFSCSRATLYRLFAPMGGIADYIRKARLERSYADLLSAPDHITVTQVALRWGFGNFSNFCRTFRSTFGLSPGEAQEQGRSRRAALANASTPGFDSGLWLPEYRSWLEGI